MRSIPLETLLGKEYCAGMRSVPSETLLRKEVDMEIIATTIFAIIVRHFHLHTHFQAVSPQEHCVNLSHTIRISSFRL